MNDVEKKKAAEPACGGLVIWLTGLPAAGKTTLALELERQLRAGGCAVVRLDGDVLRRGLCADLGYTPEGRGENVRRAAEVARLVADAGGVCVAALISPLAADRVRARQIVGEDRFVEVFLATPGDVCRRRDNKGNYARADRGELAAFTGVTAPYERPAAPEVTVHPEHEQVEESAAQVLGWVALRHRRGRADA